MSSTHDEHKHETAATSDPVDAWHDHSHDERPQAAHGEVQDTGRIMFIGVGLFIAVVVSVIAVYGFYTFYTTKELSAAELSTPNSPALLYRTDMAKSQAMILAGGQLKLPALEEGKPERVVNILPFEQATDRVVAEYLGKRRVSAD